jgi:acetone carboxylase gamma subunit
MKIRITEYLAIDLAREKWLCQCCGRELAPAGENYKHGCLVAEVPMETAHPPLTDSSFSFTPDPDFCRLLEFYCPDCGTTIENEYLPPGHPITHDIELDVAALKLRHGVA